MNVSVSKGTVKEGKTSIFYSCLYYVYFIQTWKDGLFEINERLCAAGSPASACQHTSDETRGACESQCRMSLNDMICTPTRVHAEDTQMVPWRRDGELLTITNKKRSFPSTSCVSFMLVYESISGGSCAAKQKKLTLNQTNRWRDGCKGSQSSKSFWGPPQQMKSKAS